MFTVINNDSNLILDCKGFKILYNKITNGDGKESYGFTTARNYVNRWISTD